LQNKANFKMGNITINIAAPKTYANKQQTTNNERCSKQTQSNPISNDQSQVGGKSKPISKAETAYPACRTRDCHPFDCAQGRLPRNDNRAGDGDHRQDARATGMAAAQAVSRGFF
jgi:hypothetical protein